MNGVNFFSWIRDGVRQSVLLGVSDAVEQLGTPASAEEIHPSVAGLLGPRTAQRSTDNLPIAMGRSDASKKRLGRSLKDLDSPKTGQ